MELRSDRGIEYDRQVILDEPTGGVTALTCQPAKIIFPDGERTGPDKKLNEKTPDEGGKVEFPKPAPAQNQKTAENGEDHKGEMQKKHQIGQQLIKHPDKRGLKTFVFIIQYIIDKHTVFVRSQPGK